MTRQSRLTLIGLFYSVVVAGGCGGSSSIKVTNFTEEHAKLFEDAVDFISDPDLLEDKVGQQWQDDLNKRYDLADFIGIVTVSTLVSEIDLEKRTTFRLASPIVRPILGNSPKKELLLAVSEDSEGYPRVEQNQARILNRNFIAFVKWYKQSNGEPAAHWHLSPASDRIVGLIDKIAARESEGKKVVRVVVQKD
jgi:hypothetical protein